MIKDKSAEIAELRELVDELEGKLERAQIEYDYKQNECDHHYGKSMEWKHECGELKAQLSASQQRERAAVEDLRVVSIEGCMECNYCTGKRTAERCNGCRDGSHWQWRGPQEANRGEI